MTPSRVWGRTAGGTAAVRVAGRATFAQAPALHAFLLGCADRGISRFEIALEECAYMDSTFLGVLAMLAMGHRKGRWEAEILNAQPHVLGQIAELGLRPYFGFAERPIADPDSLVPLPQSRPAECAPTMRTAHNALAHLDPGNKARFADVLAALAQERSS